MKKESEGASVSLKGYTVRNRACYIVCHRSRRALTERQSVDMPQRAHEPDAVRTKPAVRFQKAGACIGLVFRSGI